MMKVVWLPGWLELHEALIYTAELSTTFATATAAAAATAATVAATPTKAESFVAYALASNQLHVRTDLDSQLCKPLGLPVTFF